MGHFTGHLSLPTFLLPLDSFIFLGAAGAIELLAVVERALFPSVARISLIRSTYVRVPSVRRPASGDPYRESSTNAITLAEMLQHGLTDCGRIQNANEQADDRPRPARSPDRNRTKCRVVVVVTTRAASPSASPSVCAVP